MKKLERTAEPILRYSLANGRTNEHSLICRTLPLARVSKKILKTKTKYVKIAFINKILYRIKFKGPPKFYSKNYYFSQNKYTLWDIKLNIYI